MAIFSGCLCPLCIADGNALAADEVQTASEHDSSTNETSHNDRAPTVGLAETLFLGGEWTDDRSAGPSGTPEALPALQAAGPLAARASGPADGASWQAPSGGSLEPVGTLAAVLRPEHPTSLLQAAAEVVRDACRDDDASPWPDVASVFAPALERVQSPGLEPQTPEGVGRSESFGSQSAPAPEDVAAAASTAGDALSPVRLLEQVTDIAKLGAAIAAGAASPDKPHVAGDIAGGSDAFVCGCALCAGADAPLQTAGSGYSTDDAETVPGSGYGSEYVDTLIMGTRWAGGTATYTYGSEAGQAWSYAEWQAFETVVRLYEEVCDFDFVYVQSYDVDIVWREKPASYFSDPSTLGSHDFPGIMTFGTSYGSFNAEHESWSNLNQGSKGFVTLLHEIGHGLGLAHPHDGAYLFDAGALPFPGVDNPYDSGTNGLNQGIWTTMSYLRGWSEAPAVHVIGGESYGNQGTLMAFDVAALHALYGANMQTRTGDDVYVLQNGNATGTFWSCIWDAGGVDAISNAGSDLACTIDLRAAPLTGANAGGYVSRAEGVKGGFTIANGAEIENAIGGEGADEIVGNDLSNALVGNGGNDTLTALAGDDWLYGGGGNDKLNGGTGTDRLYGGAGNDWYFVDRADDLVDEQGHADAADAVIVSGITSYTLPTGIELLVLLDGATVGWGNELANVMVGNGDGNALYGRAGNDRLFGKDGGDSLFGGEGDDELDGELGNDTLSGGAGVDKMSGGNGDDVYFVDDPLDRLIEFVNHGWDLVYAEAHFILPENVEDLEMLGSGDFRATGNALANKLVGNSGSNLIDGRAGADYLVGGGGDDVFVVGSVGDRTIELADGGRDTVRAWISWSLGDNVERLELLGSAARGIGNELSNTIVGNSGANLIDGRAGADYLVGGGGDDVFVVGSVGDKTIELADGGRDTVRAWISWSLGDNVERLELLGSAARGIGNELSNTIVGNSGGNTLAGKFGNDYLVGGAGDDVFVFDTTLDAGANTDRIADFTSGSDRFLLDSEVFAGLSVGQLAADAFVEGAPTTELHRILYDSENGWLAFDADGTGTAFEATVFARVAPQLALAASDFAVA
ncbi:M10 family metallopeptidase C-terminal domain-containing protein [Salinarimonas sp.]|uniref:M10 family metallopeptidase C-terminal domain-containing protein n=1 Tax=Salinarimonas sp. TaxID=2766526 RepID=UPI0032D98524